MVVDGDYLLVNLQRLSGFMGTENSALAVIDTANDTIVDVDPMKSGTQPLVLPGKNSFGGLVRVDADTFAVGLTGSYGMQDGEIVRIDRSGPGSYSVGETVVTEMALGGDLTDYAMVDAESGFALVSLMEDGNFVTKLKYFSTGSGMTQVEEVSAIENAAGALCLTPDKSQVWVAESAMGSKGFWGIDVDSRMAVNSEAFPPTSGTARSCVIR
jgi:sugar lactone lactonase YvrE